MNPHFRSDDPDFIELNSSELRGYCNPDDLDLFLTYDSEEIPLELERFAVEVQRTNP